MDRQDIHVVFGKSAKGQLIQSNQFDLDSIKLVCLGRLLESRGPIADVDADEEIIKE